MIVEENLHIKFSESTPNVVGTQSNGFAGTKASDNAGQARKETEPVDEDPRKESECKDQKKEDNVNSTNNVNTISSTVNAVSTNEDNELLFDPYMHALEDVIIFNFLNDDKDDGIMADMNNLDTTIQVSPIPTTRIYKDHPLDQVIGDLHSTTQTRMMSKIGGTWEEPKKVIHALKDPSWIEAIQEELLQFKLQEIEEEVYVCQPLGFEDPDLLDRVYKDKKVLYGLHQDPKAWFAEVKTASTPIETQKPLLKDEDGEKVYVHMYRLMIGSLMYLTSSRPDSMFAVCACARYQVNIKVSHLYAVKRIFRYLKGQLKLGLWYPKGYPFDLVAYTDSDYAGRKSTTEGCQFLKCRLISWQCKKQTMVANSTTKAEYMAASRYAKKCVRLTMEKLFGIELELILLSTAKAKTINGEVQIHARVVGKEIVITESSIKRDLRLADEEGIDCLPNSTTIKQLALMGPIRKVTQVPRPSDPMEHVANEVVHKELGDSLVSAATTAYSLEAKQDSGGGPRCQEAMGDTTAQTRVESSRDEESLGEDVVRRYFVAEEEVVKDVNENVVEEVVNATEDSTVATTTTIITKEINLAQSLEALKTLKPKVKGIVIYEQEEPSKSTTTATIPKQQSQDKGKGVMIKEPVKPKKKDQIKLDEEAAKRLQAQEQEELSDAEKATLFQQLLEKRRKHFAAKRVEEKRNKPSTQAQKKKIMCTYLKNMEGYKLKDLKLKEFDKIQDIFDRAFRRKIMADVNFHIPLEGIKIDNKLHFVEEPTEIMDHEVKKLKKSWIPIVKVCWNSQRGPEISWEQEDEMKRKGPEISWEQEDEMKRKLVDKQSGRPSGSIPSNTQPNPKGSSSKPYQPPQALNEHVNAIFTRSDEGSEILHSIEGTILEEKLFAEFDEFMAMTADENSESESDTEEPPFEKITFNTDYKIKTFLEEPPTDLELKPLLDNLEYVFFNRVKQEQLNLEVGTERMIFHIDYAMKHSYSNNDTCFSIDDIDEIVEEDFEALLYEGSEILHSIEGTIFEEKLFAEFDEFMAMTANENSESESNTKEPPFEKNYF
nr:putative ribonuclease H-like domain-containing protein [Tanacetum cinerariifolium]